MLTANDSSTCEHAEIFPEFLEETSNCADHNFLPADVSGRQTRELISAEIKNAPGDNASLLAGAYGYSLRLFVGPVAL